MGALLYGLLLGLGAWLIPGAILGWLVRAAVLGFRDWLDDLQVTIPLPLTEGITIDLASALSLGDTQARLAALSGQDLTLVLAVALGTAAAGMLLTGLTAFLGAVFYNLFAGVFGGVEIRLDSLDAPSRPGTLQKVSVEPQDMATTKPPATSRQNAVAPPPVAQPALAAWLSAVNGGERRALRSDVTRIGSAPENDIVLAGLAPQHAEIRRESGRYLLYDLGSRRTWVNDSQVAAVHMLKDGFRLQLGQSEFIVHLPVTNQAIAEG